MTCLLIGSSSYDLPLHRLLISWLLSCLSSYDLPLSSLLIYKTMTLSLTSYDLPLSRLLIYRIMTLTLIPTSRQASLNLLSYAFRYLSHYRPASLQALFLSYALGQISCCDHILSRMHFASLCVVTDWRPNHKNKYHFDIPTDIRESLYIFFSRHLKNTFCILIIPIIYYII